MTLTDISPMLQLLDGYVPARGDAITEAEVRLVYSFREALKSLPHIEVTTSEWLDVPPLRDGRTVKMCKICAFITGTMTPYCPRCGALMKYRR